MQQNIRLFKTAVALAVAFASTIVACNDSGEAEDTRSLITWEPGDLDPYGCAYATPEPWVSEEVHREACGEGCEVVPIGWDQGFSEDMFVGCLATEVGYPPSVVLQSATCLTHPVTRRQIWFVDSRGATLQAVCWKQCEGLELGDEIIPDECFEDPVDTP